MAPPPQSNIHHDVSAMIALMPTAPTITTVSSFATSNTHHNLPRYSQQACQQTTPTTHIIQTSNHSHYPKSQPTIHKPLDHYQIQYNPHHNPYHTITLFSTAINTLHKPIIHLSIQHTRTTITQHFPSGRPNFSQQFPYGPPNFFSKATQDSPTFSQEEQQI